MKAATNLLHKEEDMLIATSLSSELSMTFQICQRIDYVLNFVKLQVAS